MWVSLRKSPFWGNQSGASFLVNVHDHRDPVRNRVGVHFVHDTGPVDLDRTLTAIALFDFPSTTWAGICRSPF